MSDMWEAVNIRYSSGNIDIFHNFLIIIAKIKYFLNSKKEAGEPLLNLLFGNTTREALEILSSENIIDRKIKLAIRVSGSKTLIFKVIRFLVSFEVFGFYSDRERDDFTI